jgi:benzoate-CoA ligase family protein
MIKGESFEFPLPEQLNLGTYFLDANLDTGRGDKTALYCKDKVCTYVELWRLTNQTGNVLKELGVEPEDRVLLILEDSFEWVAAWLATLKLGAVGTHAYTYLTVLDYTYLLDLIRPKAVIADGSTIGVLRKAVANSKFPKIFLVAGEGTGDLRKPEFSLHAMQRSADEHLEVEPTHRDDIAYWSFSGGSTGKTKAVPHMHRDAVIGYESFNYMFHYTSEDIVLGVPKLFFHYHRDNGLLYALRSGAAVVLFPERATPALIFELIRKHRPTVLLNVPTMMRAMLQTPKSERADLSCLRFSLSSGEALSAPLYQDWVDAFGSEVCNRVGSAEAGGYLTNRPRAVRPGSSGTVSPLVEVKLVDGEGGEVPRGTPGGLLVRNDAAGQYYVREHEKSKATFLGDDWVRTGDIFYQDADDYFWYVGRADDAVKVSGVWVAPLEVEFVLHTCDRVNECAVVGIPDADGLTKLKAFVVLRDGARPSENMQDELRQFLKARVAAYKVPRLIEFVDELPKTGQGKIDKLRLRERSL